MQHNYEGTGRFSTLSSNTCIPTEPNRTYAMHLWVSSALLLQMCFRFFVIRAMRDALWFAFRTKCWSTGDQSPVSVINIERAEHSRELESATHLKFHYGFMRALAAGARGARRTMATNFAFAELCQNVVRHTESTLLMHMRTHGCWLLLRSHWK